MENYVKQIKVLHICSSKFGGAGIAAYRLHNSLNEIAGEFIHSNWLDNSMINHPRITLFQRIINKTIKFFANERYKKSKNKAESDKYVLFSSLEGPLKRIEGCYDIIHLHWISSFVDYHSIFKNVKIPIVWTCHDKNPFMGGFHYILDKNRTKKNFILSQLDNKIFRKKKLLYSHSSLKSFIVTTTDFQKNIKNIFPDLRIVYIPLGFNVDIFKPRNKILCFNLLKISFSKDITILFVTQNISDYRKGWDLLIESLRNLKIKNSIRIVCVGESYNDYLKLNNHYIEVINLGFITDNKLLSCVYNISDVLIMPSREEAFGQVMAESLLCGTPVIGFRTSGVCDLIINNFNGYIVNEISSKALYDVINTFILTYNEINYDRFIISENAKEKLDNYIIVHKHYELYRSILEI